MKDVLGKTVKIGDKVVVVCKTYRYRGIEDAYLVVATYDGDTPNFSKFITGKNYHFRVSRPSVYKI